jgi:hypothetical protein
VEHIKGKAFLEGSVAVWNQGNVKLTDWYKRKNECIKEKNSGDEMLPVRYWPDNRKVNGKIKYRYYYFK